MRHRWPFGLLLVALLVAACASPSASPTESEPAASEPAASEPAASEPAESQAAASQAAGEMTSVFDLENGQCFNDAGAQIVDEVEVVDCDALHDYEIYHVVDHAAGPSDAWIGNDEMQTFVDDECKGSFESFVGLDYDSSVLYIYFLAPTENTWSAGDREVICSLYSQDGQLEGSMEGSEI